MIDKSAIPDGHVSCLLYTSKKAYEKAGFRVEGILRDAIWDNGVYADDILMSILEEEWKQIA